MNFNQGCGVSFAKPASYGSDFNDAGGGYYVLVRTKADGIRVWFWSRYDPTVPPEIRAPPYTNLFNPEGMYPTAYWGEPEAVFPLGDQCDYASHFNAHAFVFDLTFCVSILPCNIYAVIFTQLMGRIGRVIGPATSTLRLAAQEPVMIVSIGPGAASFV